MFFVLLRPIFCEKLKIAPPPHTKTAPPQTSELAKLDEKSVSISVKTFFFWRTPDFGRKKPLNFWFRPKNHSQFQWRPFFFFRRTHDFERKKPLNFGFSAEKSLSISVKTFFIFLENTWFWAVKTFEFRTSAEKSLSISVKTFFFFGEHLIFGGKNLWISELSEKFRLNFQTNRLKLIQVQWKFESRSFAQFSLFQNSPPPPFPNPGYAPGSEWVIEYLNKYFMNWFLEYSNKKPAQLIFHDFLR